MSNHEIGYTDKWGFQLIKRAGRVEMEYHSEKDTWNVFLYENANQNEEWLLYTSKRDKEKADKVFDSVVELLKA
jgi:hypothetical protein